MKLLGVLFGSFGFLDFFGFFGFLASWFDFFTMRPSCSLDSFFASGFVDGFGGKYGNIIISLLLSITSKEFEKNYSG